MNIGIIGYLINLQLSLSIRKAYQAMRGSFIDLPWKKVMCNTPAPVKREFTGWLAKMDQLTLTTCNRLKRIGIECDSYLFCEKFGCHLSVLSTTSGL